MNSSALRVIRVVLADDHPLLRSGIRSELASHTDIQVIGEAANGNEALRLTEEHHPDVLLLDINMPGLRALDVMRQVRQQMPAPRVIILSAYGDYEHAVAFLSAGARGYILKNDESPAIVDAVRAVTQGILWLSPGIAQVIQRAMGSPLENAPERLLTAREIEVLRMMARGWDNQRIAHSLNISEATVKFHIGHIYDKLGVATRVEAVLYCIHQGLVNLDVTEASNSP